MSATPYIAEAAALIGDPARANMLVALMDGQALTATELGLIAGVAPSTASEHLSKLLGGHLVTVIASGRHRYFRLGSKGVAEVIEKLMLMVSDSPRRFRPRSCRDEAMATARTCYDHFAGRLGVGIADGLSHRRMVVLADDGGLVTPEGLSFLEGIGVDLTVGSRKVFCRPCLDWSERRWHIGGTVGAAIAARSFELGWTQRQRDSRAINITARGREAFCDLFGIALPDAASCANEPARAA